MEVHFSWQGATGLADGAERTDGICMECNELERNGMYIRTKQSLCNFSIRFHL